MADLQFISLNKNGTAIMFCMTLVAAVMIMIYRKENDVGFTAAKRRMLIELQYPLMAVTVILSGGDLKKLALSSP